MKKRTSLAIGLGLAAALGVASVGSQEKPLSAPAAAARAIPATWAYQPIKPQPVPATQDRRWVRTPIDAFVLAKLEAAKLKPSPEADRHTLVRRVYLDAHGLIPTPDEVKAFVNDRSPDAYEKLVDRVLASPHYGERAGRRWLDLARFADTTGYSDDEQRPGMWRYRDYVIKAFNDDKPFDQFVREQIAGDELWPDKQEARVATGFLRGYPDAPDHRDLVQKRYQSITDMTDTVGTVLLGQTLECARCHNHKADRISQKEYFQLQAFFANTIPSDTLPVLEKGERERKFEAEFTAWQAATQPARQKIEAFIAPHKAAVLRYGKERFYEDGRAALLKPEVEWNALDRWLNYRFNQYVVKDNPDYGWDYSFYGMTNAYFRNAYEQASADKDFDKTKLAELKTRQEQYAKLLRDYREFNAKRPEPGATIISGLTELGRSDAAKQFIYEGGNHERPLDEVQPAFPALITPKLVTPKITPTAHSSGRRIALAEWLLNPENPLTTRVFVNRLWASYFDSGIVPTVSDFGRAGQRPSHPELLDHLATSFVRQGWSVKKLTREILLSSVYRQASTYREDLARADPDNRLLAQFPRKRLDSEQVRDSLLAAAGLLQERNGGPGVYPPIPDAVMKQSTRRVAAFWPVSKNAADHHTRSVYVYVRRSVPYPLFETFDGASSSNPHSRREVTTTPQQSLTLFNNDVVYEWSKALAGRTLREAGRDENAQIDRLFQILYSRLPQKEERRAALAFLDQHDKSLRSAATEGRLTVALPVGLKELPNTQATRLAAFVDLAHTLANSNEFVYRF
jgi:hypothetical protein